MSTSPSCDPDGDIAPGTLFEKLPEDWVCPECAEPKDQFIERNGLSSVSKGGFLHALCENCYRKSLLGRRQ